MNFYVSVCKENARIISIKRYPDMPEVEHMKGMAGNVLTGVFELFGQRFMALDGGPIFTFNESISFLVSCKDQAEIDYYWNALTTDGGTESQCGWCKDKYGLSWQITPDMSEWLEGADTEGSQRALKALFGMRKIDIAALKAAYEGSNT